MVILRPSKSQVSRISMLVGTPLAVPPPSMCAVVVVKVKLPCASYSQANLPLRLSNTSTTSPSTLTVCMVLCAEASFGVMVVVVTKPWYFTVCCTGCTLCGVSTSTGLPKISQVVSAQYRSLTELYGCDWRLTLPILSYSVCVIMAWPLKPILCVCMLRPNTSKYSVASPPPA